MKLYYIQPVGGIRVVLADKVLFGTSVNMCDMLLNYAGTRKLKYE